MKTSLLELSTVDSTNTYAKVHFDVLADGTIVAADCQTAGRGRLHRLWISPPGENIYASFVMKRVDRPFYATITGSLAVLDTLREYAPGVCFYIKWPNDVYAGRAKIAGILSEGVFVTAGSCAGIITGMGVNVNSGAAVLSGTDGATSLHLLTGKNFSVKKVLETLAKKLEECYITYLTAPERLFLRWKKENLLIGRELEFVTPDGRTIRSVFRGIDADGGALILDGGLERVFDCGDLRILKDSLPEDN